MMARYVCRADHERTISQAEKQRQRADRAERALEPLRHNIRQLTAEVEAKDEEIRVVCYLTTPVCTPSITVPPQAAISDNIYMRAVPWSLRHTSAGVYGRTHRQFVKPHAPTRPVQATEGAQQWEKRAQQLQQKYGKVDLAEHQRVQAELKAVQAELSQIRAEGVALLAEVQEELVKVPFQTYTICSSIATRAQRMQALCWVCLVMMLLESRGSYMPLCGLHPLTALPDDYLKSI